jgi:hypothetical protein
LGAAIGIAIGGIAAIMLLFIIITKIARDVVVDADPVYEGPAVELRLQRLRKSMKRLPTVAMGGYSHKQSSSSIAVSSN